VGNCFLLGAIAGLLVCPIVEFFVLCLPKIVKEVHKKYQDKN